MSGPLSGPSGGMLPAGRYKLEVHRVGPLAAEVSLEEPCYVLQASAHIMRRQPQRLAVPADTAGAAAAEGDWHLMLVLAIPVEAT